MFDEDLEAREKEQAALRKIEHSKRKLFEGRMLRKAKREGKPEDYYMNIGATPPTAADLKHVRGLPDELKMGWWRSKFSQHCYAYHNQEGGCPRDRGCAFHHTEITAKVQDPSWLEEANEA